AGVLPPELAVEDLSRLLEGFLANAEALAGWRPGRYQGEVLLLQGRSSRVLAGGDAGDAWGWRGVAPGVEVVALEGDHYTLVQEPGVATLAEVLGERLVGAPA
ncbi:MAG TPA: hypothetical protein PK413_18140, partial [Thermoanaerobaculia bacterium]|nr:hypothetical protein [Thermoanaerobaculia bacterium]